MQVIPDYAGEEETNVAAPKKLGSFLTGVRYGELEDEPCDGLTRCDYCTPPLRKAEIEEINRIYAPGGDHDPVMTEALKKCPRIQRK